MTQNFKKKIHFKWYFLLLIMFLASSVLILTIYFVKAYETASKNSSIESEKYIVDEIKKCNGERKTNPCYQQIAINFLDRYPLNRILAVFKKNERSADFIKSCHTISHYLGQEEYKRLKSVKAVLLESSTDICIAGTIHGAVEGFFMEKKINDYQQDILKIKEAIPEACGKKSSYDNLIEYQTCVHGLGHALMNVAENDLVKALKLCDYLPAESDQEYCYSGSLMQNSSDAFSSEHPSKYYSTSDPLYPCYILDQKYQKRCYSYGALGRFQLDPQKSIDTCNKIPQEYRHNCFQTYGVDRVTVRQSEEEIKKECDLIKSDEYKIDCYNGASYDFIARYGLDSTLGHIFCKHLDTKFKYSCYKQLGIAANRFTQNKNLVKNYCDKVYEKEFKNICQSP